MRRPYARLAAAGALAAATAVFCGSAFAGGGHGSSANAPGQQKQEQSQPPALQQLSQQQSQEAGTKPSSTTKHWTDTHVGDSPDVSKRYGNGTTAAQIAASRGAPASQPLEGPGNSQPHKTYDCAHTNNRSGGVDVHAIKRYSSTGCETTQPQQHAEKPVVKTPEVQKPTEQTSPAQAPAGEHMVTICHATGSATNPYVRSTVDEHAVATGHTPDEGDIVPAPAGGCPTAAPQSTPVVPTVGMTTATQQQSLQTVTVATTTPEAATVTTTTPEATTVTTAAKAAKAARASAAGAVLGARTSLPKPKANHGVLGTVTHVAGGTLPFTGFPVWPAVLIAVALILGGIALQRRGAGARL